MKISNTYSIFSIVALLIVFSSCKMYEKNNYIILKKEYDITTLEHRTNRAAGFVKATWIDENDHIYVKGIRNPQNHYIKWDRTDAKILDSVDLRCKRYMDVLDVEPIGKDSFLLALNSVYENDFHDEVMLVINRERQIIDTIKMENLPVRTHKNLMSDDPNRHFLYYHPWFPLKYVQHKIFIPLTKWSDNSGVSKSSVGFISYPSPNSEGNFTSLPITYPATDRNHYWPMWYRFPLGALSKENLYVMFGNSPFVFKYNLENQTIKKEKVSFSTIGKIHSYPMGETANQYDAYNPQYIGLVHDSINHLLYIVAKVSCDKSDGPLATQDKNFVYSFVVLNEDLTKIGEGIIPEGYFYNIIPYKKGFLLFKSNTEYATYTYFTYTTENNDKDYLKRQIKFRRDSLNKISPKMSVNDSYIAYLKNIVGDHFNKYSSFILFSESACPYCAPLYQKVINDNRRNIIDNKIAIIMVSSDTTLIEDFCYNVGGLLCTKETLLDPKKIPIYCDSSNIANYYLEYWINIKYISLDELHQISKVVSVHPGNIEDLEFLLQY